MPIPDNRFVITILLSSFVEPYNSTRTDLNLVSGCKILGYDDILHEKYEDLFFTNLIPGYRTENTSTGGFKAVWVNEQVKKDFRDLIEILQPQVILCLGKDVYRQAAAIFGYKRVLNGKDWNRFLDDDPAPLALHGESGHASYLFAMPHPGYYGEMNRKKSVKGKTMKDDWKRIRTWLDQNPWNV